MSSLIQDIIDSAKRLIGIKKQISEHEYHVLAHKELVKQYVQKTQSRTKSFSKIDRRKSSVKTRSKKLKKLNKKAKSRVS